MTITDVGRCLTARAGRATHRAMLRCLGHTATIAIAALSLAGCGSFLDPTAINGKEVPPGTYQDIAITSAHDPVERDMVRGFMADGKIDYRELGRLVAYHRAKEDAAVPLARLKREFASGTVTEGGDAKQAPGDSLSGPAPERGDAQGTHP
jgi:hypothetical protein